MWQALKEEVRGEYARFDVQVHRWVDRHEKDGGRIHCRRGCSNCCALAVNATFSEALCVVDSLPEEAAADLTRHVERTLAAAERASGLKGWLQEYRKTVGPCPFLGAEGACRVYADRPFACRALLATRNADWCGFDLSTLHPLEKEAFLSGLDRSAVAWPTHYVAATQEAGLAFETASSWRMTTAFNHAITGNLPFLVWLQREFDLAHIIPRGPQAVLSLLSEKGLLRPFLIELLQP